MSLNWSMSDIVDRIMSLNRHHRRNRCQSFVPPRLIATCDRMSSPHSPA